jgi:hypothetical protein
LLWKLEAKSASAANGAKDGAKKDVYLYLHSNKFS